MKKIYLLFALSLCALVSFAQFVDNWRIRYSTTLSANYSNEGRRIVEDANSNIFVLGDYSSDNDSAGHTVGTTQYSVRIHKYDYNGSLVTWAFIPLTGLINNGTDNRSGFGMELDASGNVYVGYTVLNAQGNFDVSIAKYSNSLVRQWLYTYSTSNNDVGVDLKVVSSNAYAVVKSYSGPNTTYSIVEAEINVTSPFALYSFVQNTDVVNALYMAGNKNIYVTGYSLVSGYKSVLTACVQTSGVLRWKSYYNHGSVTGDDFGKNLMVGSDGKIYVIGTTYTSAANNFDGLVLQYGASGALLKYLFLGGAGADAGGAIASGPANYIFASSSNATSATVYKVQTNNQLGIILSANYVPTPTNGFTSITDVSIADMKVAASNNVYLCGTVTGTSAGSTFASPLLAKFGLIGFVFKVLNYQPFVADNGDNYASVALILDGYKNDILYMRNNFGNYSSHSSEKVDITDLDGGTSLRLAHEDATSTSVASQTSFFPNPASDKIIVTAAEEIRSIDISDLTGKIVRSVRPDAAEVEVTVSDLNKGLYICKTTTASGAVTMKRLMIN